MALSRLTAEEYNAIFGGKTTAFGSVAFNELNRGRADEVAYLASPLESTEGNASLSNDCRLGLIAGLKEGRWMSPFSSPFGEIAANGIPDAEDVSQFLDDLKDFANGREVELTFHPPFYAPQMSPILEEILPAKAKKIVRDLNYHYDLSDFADFEAHLNRAARKNFHRAQSAGFSFMKTDDAQRAYAVIKANRDSHGYRLAMTFDQVEKTIRIVDADFFLLTLDEKDVAAAMVYHVAPGIVQVIYWGDAPGYSPMRPMNILPYYLFDYYDKCGLRIVDIGPSSTDGIPNEGLCRFKESIGCRLTYKITAVL